MYRVSTALFLGLLLGVVGLAGCADGEADDPQEGKAGARAADTEKFAESDVADIVNAVNAKDVGKVAAMLKANPKLVKARWTGGGPGSGWPLVMIAASNGDKPLVELLLNHGADVNDKNYSNETALMYAAREGHKEIVEVLLAKKADVNSQNDVGSTALGAATGNGKTDVADLLKQHGAK